MRLRALLRAGRAGPVVLPPRKVRVGGRTKELAAGGSQPTRAARVNGKERAKEEHSVTVAVLFHKVVIGKATFIARIRLKRRPLGDV